LTHQTMISRTRRPGKFGFPTSFHREWVQDIWDLALLYCVFSFSL